MTRKIIMVEETGNGNGGNNTFTRNIKISGTAFLDENEDGKRDVSEKVLEGIDVLLIDNTTGSIAKNENGQEQRKTTDGNGSYEFSNLNIGNYIVVFIYDNVVYTVTNYQQTGVASSLNSDAIEREFIQDEKKLLAGVTDTISAIRSISNIDIGLVSRDKFDLKLEKTLIKATVQNKEGTKVFNYNNSKLGQLPVTAKYLNGSTIIVEYKIKITNEGNIPGYAKSIVDYMPKEMTFNSTLNPNWYIGNDGYLYTTALEKELINPGETKEINLLLTKKLTEKSTGIVNNTAEIKESYNEKGLKDRDSTAGNKNQGEDDQDLADIIITIKTGGRVLAVSFSLLLALLAGGLLIYYIKTKDQRKFIK